MSPLSKIERQAETEALRSSAVHLAEEVAAGGLGATEEARLVRSQSPVRGEVDCLETEVMSPVLAVVGAEACEVTVAAHPPRSTPVALVAEEQILQQRAAEEARETGATVAGQTAEPVLVFPAAMLATEEWIPAVEGPQAQTRQPDGVVMAA